MILTGNGTKAGAEGGGYKINQFNFLVLHHRKNISEYLQMVELECIVFVMILAKIKNSHNILCIDQLE
jgi:hypothetical protein